jgi:Reversibly glycosylated polypeptide
MTSLTPQGTDFVRGYPFSLREGVPTAVSHGEGDPFSESAPRPQTGCTTWQRT